jgi:hypothetical protein
MAGSASLASLLGGASIDGASSTASSECDFGALQCALGASGGGGGKKGGALRAPAGASRHGRNASSESSASGAAASGGGGGGDPLQHQQPRQGWLARLCGFIGGALSPRGPGDNDTTLAERVANVLTAAPMLACGYHMLRTRSSHHGRLFGGAFVAVSLVASAYHAASGAMRCAMRKLDYWCALCKRGRRGDAGAAAPPLAPPLSAAPITRLPTSPARPPAGASRWRPLRCATRVAWRCRPRRRRWRSPPSRCAPRTSRASTSC